MIGLEITFYFLERGLGPASPAAHGFWQERWPLKPKRGSVMKGGVEYATVAGITFFACG